MLTSPLNKLGLAIFITKNACQHRCRQYHRTSSSEIPLTHSYSYTIGLGLTRGASSCAPATHSMTSSLHVIIIYFYLSRHIYFYHTSSPSAESAYIIPIFTILRRHFKQYKRQHKTRFTHSPTQQRQRHYSSPAEQHQRHVYYLTSNDMDELRNLERIEELCRNLREQQERQRNQHSPPIVTPTG